MQQKLPAYQKIDMETWPRKHHFEYYRNTLQCGYSLTSRVDVTDVLGYAKTKKKKFYACFLYAASKTVNQLDFLRLMIPEEGGAGIWEVSNPNFTVFHQDDETFSDIWMEYHSDFEEFYQEFEKTIHIYGNNKGIKARPDTPANFFCISCVPWLDYSGCSTYSVGEPALFPIITFGKYTRENDAYTLPITLTISHASADGYHASLFFQKLQENLQNFHKFFN
ncbi:MAG: chloramphenicol acetyltransferase [Lachnospiraceae bacterium]|nr:chloramphenicol acetyltransferase [Lachnospiraceae bacterium]